MVVSYFVLRSILFLPNTQSQFVIFGIRVIMVLGCTHIMIKSHNRMIAMMSDLSKVALLDDRIWLKLGQLSHPSCEEPQVVASVNKRLVVNMSSIFHMPIREANKGIATIVNFAVVLLCTQLNCHPSLSFLIVVRQLVCNALKTSIEHIRHQCFWGSWVEKILSFIIISHFQVWFLLTIESLVYWELEIDDVWRECSLW